MSLKNQNMIIPTLLCKTSEEFIEKLNSIEPLVDIAQIDAMDNTLVNGETFYSSHELENIKSRIDFELHLMVVHPIIIMREFAETPNIKRVYVHAESKDDLRECINEARFHGFEIGIAMNPETTFDCVEPYIYEIDSVMFMCVKPGASGNSFEKKVLKKIKEFHKKYPDVEIAVDGGVNHNTIIDLQNAGASRFAVGSEIFENHESPQTALNELQKLLHNAQ